MGKVQKYLRENKEEYIKKVSILNNLEIIEGGYGIVCCDDEIYERAFIAKIADNVCTVGNVKASFCIGRYTKDGVSISARSLDEENVQVIMEKLGGGGHYTTAAVQFEGCTILQAKERLLEVLKQNVSEGEQVMKKTVVIRIFIVVALCLALTGLGVLLKNEPESSTTITAGAPASTTSGTITTSSTTSTTTSATTTEINEIPSDPIESIELQKLFPKENILKIQITFGIRDYNYSRFVKNIDNFYEKLLNDVVVSNDPYHIERQNREWQEYCKNNDPLDRYYGSISYSIIFYDLNGNYIGSISVYGDNSIGVYFEDSPYAKYVNLSGHHICQMLVYEIWDDE
jgi:hypothetical protein